MTYHDLLESTAAIVLVILACVLGMALPVVAWRSRGKPPLRRELLIYLLGTLLVIAGLAVKGFQSFRPEMGRLLWGIVCVSGVGILAKLSKDIVAEDPRP